MRQRVLVLVFLALGFVLSGFVVNNLFKTVKEKRVMAGFAALTADSRARDLTVAEVVKYLDEQVNDVSGENASTMVLGLEEVQQAHLAKWQRRYEDEDLQVQIMQIYGDHWSPEEITNIADGELREILRETIESGYKVETAEGFYFPVIDYTFYRKYHPAVTPDLVSYLEIMAVESENTPVKDAALMIGWDEILRRATNQERFLRAQGGQARGANTHDAHGRGEDGSSTPVQVVRQLLKRYLSFALYGCNNTPLFDYWTKEMNPEARQAYEEYVANEEDGEFFAQIKAYLNVLAENDYCLTPEVDAYRKQAFSAW